MKITNVEIDAVFRAALRAVKARHGDIFPAATVEAFAWRAWQARCEKGRAIIEAHPELFMTAGQADCEYVLVREALPFAKATRPQRR
jgi:hypothetical protein